MMMDDDQSMATPDEVRGLNKVTETLFNTTVQFFGYALQCERVYFASEREPYFETVAFYAAIPDIKLAVDKHLVCEFGEDYKSDAFKHIQTYLDVEQCGGVFVEATDLQGDVLRFWLQLVKPIPRDV